MRKNDKKNFIISYNNKKDIKQSQYKDDDAEGDNDYCDNSYIPKTIQKKYFKNYPRWGSIKRGKENFFPVTESKPLYSKKLYK